MDLSVVIVSYNTKELLAKCLKSLKVSIPEKSEVFVVDNNSHDGSQEEVKRNFSWVKLIENNKNLGFSKANNIALYKAQGKFILILNPDTELEKNTLDKLLEFFKSKPKNVGMLTCRVELSSGELDKDCRRRFPTPWTAFTHFSGLSRLFAKSRIFDSYYYGYKPENIETEVEACAGAFMLIKSEALKNVGLFDEDYFFYGEDLDLCYRFLSKGYKIIYTPIVKITHYKGVASGIKEHSKHISKATPETRKKARLESIRAMRLFYKKHLEEKYPFFISTLVYFGIFAMEKVRSIKN